ncbi:MAG: DUF975 family protein [Planctomycetota bacterium]|nr:MAG: DUF975 family protein [Planctomycetota bacterium]REJ90073.1 MAG: DUF975 family protein [Planctomycetota bacterium]REK23153.1 MAG: DUF975 family protein [Planctomycetota bacterium]REK43428.1 MAG: DUF975 family protein [Planctomycetota bacterium]
MAIEFKCPQCDTLLSVPDDSAGRQAKCPSCSAVVPIPAVSDAGRDETPSPAPPTSPDAANPYASPSLSSAAPNRFATGGVEAGEIRPTRVDIGDVLSRTWEIYKEQWGMCIAAIMIVYVISGGVGMVTNIVTQVAGAIGDPVLIVLCLVVFQIVGQVFQLWLWLGASLAMLDVARGRKLELSRLFAGGPYLLRSIGAYLLFSLATTAVLAAFVGIPALVAFAVTQDEQVTLVATGIGVVVALIPFIYISLAMSQYQLLIVDKDAGAIESLQLSWQITKGNKLALFVLGLVAVGLILLGMLACCVGVFFTAPMTVLLFVVNYLAMSGQPIATPQQKNYASARG